MPASDIIHLVKHKPYFVVNPHSSNGRTGRIWPKIKHQLELNLPEIRFDFTQGPMHAARLASEALLNGNDMVVAVGGDGTLNETLNGFFQHGKPVRPDAVLGYISSGTGEDFGRNFSIEGLDMTEKINHMLNAEPFSIDYGEVECRHEDGRMKARMFINEGSCGFSSNVARYVNYRSKFLGGTLSYLLGVLKNILSLKNYWLSVEIDGNPFFEGECLIASALNGQYFGGAMQMAPQAKFDDGLFDLVVVERMNQFELIRNIGKIYSGKHTCIPKVHMARGKEIVLRSKEPVWVETDGEVAGLLEARFRIVKHGIRFCV